MILLLNFLLITSTCSFQQALRHLPFSIHRSNINNNQGYYEDGGGSGIGAIGVTVLNAKAKKKQKKKATTSAAGGGFGGKGSSSSLKTDTITKDKDDNGDYEVFPPLEEGVRGTLIPSSYQYADGNDVGEDLSWEMYDRLSQIYGFDHFNYPQEEKEPVVVEEDSSISLDDLMGGGSSGDDSSDFSSLLKPSSSSPLGGDNAISDLIASATGDTTTSSTTTTTTTTPDGERLAFLKNLPPSSKFRVLHVDPMVLAVDDFFTDEECDRYIELSTTANTKSSDTAPQRVRSKTVGKDELAKAQRTSTTWFHYFKVVPELMAKASRLLGLEGIERWEEPQTVRYQQSEKFTWHLDALPPTQTEKPMGGQRLVTLLVYLSDIGENVGGSTAFRDLGSSENGDDRYLKMVPKKGSALVFFPAAGGIPGAPLDVRTLHAGEALGSGAKDDKWIAQLWLREFVGYVPNAPVGNVHRDAVDAVKEYCSR